MRRTILAALVVVGLVGSTAWAGDLRCHVTDKAGPQAEVKVTVTPGGATLTTARDGTCLFRSLGEGTYRVTAEKTVAGKLRGAVHDEVRVPASGRADAKLQLVRAIRIHEHTPLRHGSTWSYSQRKYTWHVKEVPLDVTGWRWDRRSRREEATIAGTARFAGADVTKVEWTARGILGGTHPLHTMYETSGPAGHATYGRAPCTGDGAPYRYDPPLLIPDLWPLGHTHRLTTRIRYTDDTPSRHVTRTYTLTTLDRVEVEAGVFDDCARIEWAEEAGGTTTTGVTHLAKGVGMVSTDFNDGQAREELELRRYHIPTPHALSAAGTVPRAAKPTPPSATVQTPSK